MRALFFGCWNRPGHFLWAPGGHGVRGDTDRVELYDGQSHLDGNLAPRKMKAHHGGALCWAGQGATQKERDRIRYDSDECPEGQFLRHALPNGFTALQWWDRRQGDRRGACNSTVLLEGDHPTVVMLAALREHFPHVIANLNRAGIALVEVTPPTSDPAAPGTGGGEGT